MKSIIEAKKKARVLSKNRNIMLKEALEILAIEKGFKTWKSYKDSLDVFWYRKSSPFLNHWFVNHKQAKDYLDQYGGFLLTFKGQYFVASTDYIQYLEMDPYHPIWERIGYDASQTSSLEKIYKELVQKKEVI